MNVGALCTLDFKRPEFLDRCSDEELRSVEALLRSHSDHAALFKHFADNSPSSCKLIAMLALATVQTELSIR